MPSPNSITTSRRNAAYEARLGPDVIDEIARTYVLGAPVSLIAARHRLAAPAVAGILRRRCHTLRRGPEYLRKHHPVAEFFDVIDTEEKAYILGFVTADGCVHPERNALSIELAERDRTHLERIRDALSPGQELRPHTHHVGGRAIRQWRLNVISREMVAALARLGVGPAKSATVRPAECIPPALVRHYWRGVFDGDGCVTAMKGKTAVSRPVWVFELTGSWPMCEGFRGFLLANAVDTAARVAPAKGVARFSVGGQRVARRTAEILYAASTIALGRKKSLAESVLRQSGRRNSAGSLLRLMVWGCHQEGLGLRETAARLRICYTTLWKIRRALGLGLVNRRRDNSDE